jgi:hypothetical protein
MLVMSVATLVVLYTVFISWTVFVEYGVSRPLMMLLSVGLFLWIAFMVLTTMFLM